MKRILIISFMLFLSLFTIYCISDCCDSVLSKELNDSNRTKKIYIKPFVNNTDQYGIEVEFVNAIVNEIIMDERISLENSETESDVVIIGIIEKYILHQLFYDISTAYEQYKLFVVLNISLINKSDGKNLLKNSKIEGFQIYTDKTRMKIINGIKNNDNDEEMARMLLWKRMSKNIIRSVVRVL
ncbi:MAG: LPS assembly lipoprotein LptE [Endomicrobium sp.]|jgi:hypothetical protein|nr:LPS assembly lipoprotein LptE [Endomicrobium sp.]